MKIMSEGEMIASKVKKFLKVKIKEIYCCYLGDFCNMFWSQGTILQVIRTCIQINWEEKMNGLCVAYI
jgi:hypothetical protein